MHFVEVDLSSEEGRKRAYPGVDYVKFLCAILVVCIHTNPFSGISPEADYLLVEWIARLAVPFFFVAGGYFCFRKTSPQAYNSAIPGAYALRILKLYGVWTGIYLLPILYSELLKNQTGFLFVLQTIVFKGYYQLWYLLAAAIATALVNFCLQKRWRISTLMLVAGSFYFLSFGVNVYVGLAEETSVLRQSLWSILSVILTTRNGLFFGFVYVAMGAAFAWKKITVRPLWAVIGFVISMACMLAENFFSEYWGLPTNRDMQLSLLPAVYFLFCLASQLEVKNVAMAPFLRSSSTWVYYVHIWIRFPITTMIAELIGRLLGIADYELHSVLRFTIILGLSLLVAVLAWWLKDKKGFTWLNKLV